LETSLKDVTRREFFSELCSNDSLKSIFGAWHGFNREVKKPDIVSCDEAGKMLSKKFVKSLKSLNNEPHD